VGLAGSVLGVNETGPIVNLLPILLVGILFVLAMDYQVFLVSRMHEAHVHGDAPRQAIVAGFRTSARVVTAAAIIVAGVFSGFVLSDQVLVKSIGFALAFGVLVDAFVVRMTIVPAVMSLLGPAAWWLPRRLERILPKVDIEGRRLETHPAVVSTAAPCPAPSPSAVVITHSRRGVMSDGDMHPAPLHDDIGGVVMPLHVHVLVVPGDEVRDVEVLRVLQLLLESAPLTPRRGRSHRRCGECRDGQLRDTDRCGPEQSPAGEICHFSSCDQNRDLKDENC